MLFRRWRTAAASRCTRLGSGEWWDWGHWVIMMVMVMVVFTTRESTNIVGAITACAHILQAFETLPFGIMVVNVEVEVLVICSIIRHLVVGAGGATRLSAIPAQVLCGRCARPLADGRQVGREVRVTALSTRCGVPVLTALA